MRRLGPMAVVVLGALALAGCTAPAAQDDAPSADTAAREESRDRVTELVASLAAPQPDAFAFARDAAIASAEGVELIGIESYEPETPEGPFGSLSFRTPVDASLFPDAAEAFCFQAPLAESGPVSVDGDSFVEDIDCPVDVVEITPPPA